MRVTHYGMTAGRALSNVLDAMSAPQPKSGYARVGRPGLIVAYIEPTVFTAAVRVIHRAKAAPTTNA